MKVGFCEMPCQLDPAGPVWEALSERISGAGADMMVLNEMPFGPWLARFSRYDSEAAASAIALHERALETFDRLGTRVVIGSRPVAAGAKLANEAFAWVDGAYLPLHHKHYFPNEPGFYESVWFHAEAAGFAARDLPGAKVGAQLCTELMFNEWSRHYRREGAQIIAAPRASELAVGRWQAALAMAAVTSGCYVISSNRVGPEGDLRFGGRGFAYAPGGELLAETSARDPVRVVEVDLALVTAAQADWPCYVPELPNANGPMQA